VSDFKSLTKNGENCNAIFYDG